MKQFTMSQFASELELQRAKAKYYEQLAKTCLDHMAEYEDVIEGDDGIYRWTECKVPVGESKVG